LQELELAAVLHHSWQRCDDVWRRNCCILNYGTVY
jgi:hypothetical protein